MDSISETRSKDYEVKLVNQFVAEVHLETERLLWLGVEFEIARRAATEGVSKKYLKAEYHAQMEKD